MSNRRVWGLFGETEEQARRREADEVEHRRKRDAAGNARRRALDVEEERRREWQRIQDEGHAQQRYPDGTNSRWSPSGKAPADQDSPEARAARQEELRRLSQVEKDRQQDHRAFREGVRQQTLAARSAKESAVAAGHVEGYVAAHGRLAALESFLHEIDSAEEVRKRLGAAPGILHGASLS
jgi:hypothetical protein